MLRFGSRDRGARRETNGRGRRRRGCLFTPDPQHAGTAISAGDVSDSKGLTAAHSEIVESHHDVSGRDDRLPVSDSACCPALALVAPQQATIFIYLSPLVALYGISIGADFRPQRRTLAMTIGALLGAIVAPALAYVILGTAQLLPTLIVTALLFITLVIFGVFAGGLRDILRSQKPKALALILAFATMEAALPYAPTLLVGIGQSAAGMTIAVAWSLVICALAPFLFGAYLWTSLNCVGGHRNEAFSALHYAGYKHFIRFKLEPDHLTGYVIGFDHPSSGSNPKPKARLIHKFVL